MDAAPHAALETAGLYEERWERGEEAGVLEWNGSHVRLTPSGRLRSNELFAEFV